MRVPELIRSASKEHTPRRPVRVRMPVARGQVRVIRTSTTDQVSEHDAAERMVLVLRVDSPGGFSEVVLLHPYVELATRADLVVSPEHSTMPYRTVIETDTRSVVWTYQLDALIGELDSEALEAVGEVAVGGSAYRPNLVSGTSLRGRIDPRWEFSVREGSVVRSLAAECTSALLYDGPPLQLDPGCLAMKLLARCDDREEVMSRLLDLVTNYEVVLDLDDVMALEVVGALEVGSWVDVFGSLGDYLYKSLFWPLVEKALSVVDLSDDLVVEEFVHESTSDRRSEAGSFRRRLGCQPISASYVFTLDRESSVKLANEHGYELIDV